MTQTPTRTTVHIALFTQPDGITRAKHTIDFKGSIAEAEAITRAKHLIRAQNLGHTERGYLLNCLDIGNYVIGDLPAPTAPTQHTPAAAQHTPPAPHIPSRNAADTPDGAATAALKPTPQYTGSAIIGIAAMHKSNLVPVFSQEQALDTATMRRG